MTSPRRAAVRLFAVALLAGVPGATAHPLGNFTINHYARVEVDAERLRVRYVIDLAEIPTFQEIRRADADGDGSLSAAERDAYLEPVVAATIQGIDLGVDGIRVALAPVTKTLTVVPGAGGLPTLRVVADLAAAIPGGRSSPRRHVRFVDANDRDRIGWRELVVVPGAGIAIFDSSAFGSGLTDELKFYPTELLMAPLNERSAEWSFTLGAAPAGTTPLRTRDGRAATPARDRLAELIVLPELTLPIVLAALLIAAALGALHALSPGHGKTIVGAYLVGSRGTARHAVFLGATVTVTHTLGVFGLGFVTLFASHYIRPERLFPILSLISGGVVLVLGLSLFGQRLRAVLGAASDDPGHEHDPDAAPELHAHGGHWHSHLPPGGEAARVSWRSLLALGISGGLLPCPSALVVLLGAIALRRIGFGLLLIVAFSIGLAAALTAVGLAFVYAGSLLKPPAGARRLWRVLPAASALVIACVGVVLTLAALRENGVDPFALLSTPAERTSTVSTASLLALGLVLGLRHALDADHLAAMSTLVGQQEGLLGSSLLGALWGVGHTLSLLVAGMVVMALHVQIGPRLELALELGVAVMLILLGANAIRELRRGAHVHLHVHRHGGGTHLHHEGPTVHRGLRLGARPLAVGIVHGLAGSSALMLLVLSTIPAPLIGLAYIATFGLGSIAGMLGLSALLSLPIHFTAVRFRRANLAVRALAGVFSLSCGMVMAFEIAFGGGLFR